MSKRTYERRNYLALRRGRWLVQVPVPRDLWGRVLGKNGRPLRNVEKYLGTASKSDAKAKAPGAVGEIRAAFERARKGGPLTAAELKTEAERELRTAYDKLAADFSAAHPKLATYAAAMAEDLATGLDAIETNPLLGQTTRDYAAELIRRKGAEPTPESVATLSRAILDMHALAVDLLKKGVAPPALPEIRQSSPRESIKLLDEAWREEIKSARSPQVLLMYRHAVALLLDHVGKDAAVADVDKRKAGEFVSKLILEPMGEGEPPRSRKTVKRIVSHLATFWRWLAARKTNDAATKRELRDLWRDLEIGTDKEDGEDVREAFTDAEVLALFKGKPKGHVAARVLPDLIRLGALTGARIDELASLRVGNVRDGAINVPIGKTKSARRPIPIHDAIADIVKWRTKGKTTEEFVFPEFNRVKGKRGWAATKAFGRYLRDECKIRDPAKVFHSFRHGVVNRLLDAGVEPYLVARIVGHKVKGVTFEVYAKGPALKVLRRAMGKLRYGAAVMRAVRTAECAI